MQRVVTNGLVVKAIKYGDTSLIVHIFTAELGILTCMVKGARSLKSKYKKAPLLFPGSLLHIEVVYQPNKNFQTLASFHPQIILPELQTNIIKANLILFYVECIYQLFPEHLAQKNVFNHITQLFQQVNNATSQDLSNAALYGIFQLSQLAGYKVAGRYDEVATNYLNLLDGNYAATPPHHEYYLESENAKAYDWMNNCNQWSQTIQVQLSLKAKQAVLNAQILYLQLHTPNFKDLKTIPIIQTILHS